ncbi:MAG: IS66 family insertion sequence element accessory protein TnpA, partial [Opitutales bacterium]
MTSTTDSDEPELLLKTDRLGRVRMPCEKREQILDRFESSGMSGQAFARQIGVKYTTFAGWVQKRRGARGQYANADCKPVKAPLTLVEAVVQSEEDLASPAGYLELETVTGLKLRLNAS